MPATWSQFYPKSSGTTGSQADRSMSVSRRRPDQIVMCGATYRLIKAAIAARAFGPVSLRGRSEQVEIYEV